MTIPLEFHFDFGSPNAYLSHVLIPAIGRRTGAQVIYVPVLLGGVFKLTGNQSPVQAFAGVRNKLEYQRLEMQRFVRRHGIERFRFNPHFPVNTLLVMRIAAALDEPALNKDSYVDAVFRAMWEDGRKMDDPAVVRDALDAAGLDGAALIDRAQDPAVKHRLMDNTARSVERGVFGSPTIFVGDEMFFGKDRLAEVEEAILAG